MAACSSSSPTSNPTPCAPAPQTVVYQPAPTTVIHQPAPTTVVHQPAPTTVVHQPAPTTVVHQPAPTTVVVQPQPQACEPAKPDPEPTKPEPVTPKPDPVKPKPEPVEPKPTLKPALDARVAIRGYSVSGSLTKARIKRGKLKGGAPRDCYRKAARKAGKDVGHTVRIRFEIGETKRAKNIKVTGARLPGLKACITGLVKSVRSRRAPDLGTAKVQARVQFRPLPKK